MPDGVKLKFKLAATRGNAAKINYPATGEVPAVNTSGRS
ncbi:MAG: hypothetical protein RIS01_262 [Actinomycetota bacterium]